MTTCNTPCRTGFGDLLGATLFVGIDPPANGGATDGTGSISAASPVLAGSEAANVSHSSETAATSLTLARQPARATGLNATWIALSAGFGLTVLLLVSLVRTKGG